MVDTAVEKAAEMYFNFAFLSLLSVAVLPL
jgi:hypothetical protein